MIDSRLRWQFRLQSSLFVVLFLALMGLLAWLSQLNPLSIDLTANQRNSLSAETIRLVKSLQYPLEITIFISPLNENRDVLERHPGTIPGRARVEDDEITDGGWPRPVAGRR
jgi:hypothetical protein